MSKGLTTEKAKEKLEEVGKNELEETNKTTRLDVLERQLRNLLVWILTAAAVISLLAGKRLSFYFIAIIIAIIVLMGYLQEWKSEKIMRELEKMIELEVEVYRDGKKVTLSSSELVPGDIIILERGSKVPADAELIKSNEVRTDEASLTGESQPVDKKVGDKIYSGTTLVAGKAEARVTGTGMNTELGKIAGGVQQKEGKTPLQKKIEILSKKLALMAFAGCSIIFLMGYGQGVPIAEILVITLALIVASIPEALPLTMTITLSVGMREMAKRKAIVKKMLAVEELGSITVICTDKTGTLTRNEMTVKKLHVDGEDYEVEGSGYRPEGKIKKNGQEVIPEESQALEKLLKTALLCNNTELTQEEETWNIKGDPTEGALVVLGEKINCTKKELEEENPLLKEILFTSERKMMTTVNETPEGVKAFSKGAPEVILEKCSNIMINGEKQELTETKKKEITKKVEEYAKGALRVIAMAYKDEVKKPYHPENVEKELTLLGFVGMIDPPRKEVKKAMLDCDKASIEVKMVTGDNPLTAKAIAQEIGLSNNPITITGPELEEMTDEELKERIQEVNIFARTRPEHKLRIVNALQENGEVVAMTGDGVNDAPAVKKADVGISMGIKGTDVTKEASDIILQDDNFETIIEAVRGGRRIYNNIEKFTTYLVSRNFSEVIMIMLAIAILPVILGTSGFEAIPLIAIQILFLNMIGEELPAISLGIDPAEGEIMNRPPRDPKREILNPRNLFLTISLAIFIAIVGLIIFILGNPVQNLARTRSIVFVFFVLVILINTFSFRSLTKSIFRMNFLENKLMVASVILVIPMAFLLIYHPLLAETFTHEVIGIKEWIIAGLGAVLTNIFIEVMKKKGSDWFPQENPTKKQSTKQEPK